MHDNQEKPDDDAIELEPVNTQSSGSQKIAFDTSLDEGNPNTVSIVYILYLVGIIVGITPIIGLIMAYINIGNAPQWLKTHYQFQIRTFWIGMLYCVAGALLSVVLIGFLILLFSLIWYIARCIKGLQTVGRQEAIVDPKSWGF